MRLHFKKQRNRALTLPEVLVVVAILVVFALIFLPINPPASLGRRTQCASNLGQINLALRVWGGDNNNQYPMSVSVTSGGAMELIATNNVAAFFQVLSNELSTPKFLICPADKGRFAAASFVTNFSDANISYFINLDADEKYPQQVMAGDDNLAINGVAVKSGLVEFSTNDAVSFTASRHRTIGNIGYADGSVAEVSSAGLQSSFILSVTGTPNTTNRLAIP